jgi:hypothetical protein
MKKHLTIAAGAISLLLPVAIGFAGPADAAPSFKMPKITGMNLQEAEDAVTAAAHGVPVDMHSYNEKGLAQRQLSLTDWLVCDSEPSAGTKLTGPTDIEFGVVREFDAARNVLDPMVAKACD